MSRQFWLMHAGQRVCVVLLRRRAAAMLLAVVPLLAGCVTTQQGAAPTGTVATADLGKITNIKVNGVTYATPAEALAAKSAIYQELLGNLHADPDPIIGRLHVILPDHDRLRPLVQQQWRQQLNRTVTGAALDYLIESERQSLHASADALVRTAAFDAVTVSEQNDTVNPELIGTDYLVWFQVRNILPDNTGTWLGRWLVRRAGSRAAANAAFDPGTASGVPRYNSFVKSVHDAALRLGGRSRAGATASASSGQSRTPAQKGSGSGFVVDRQGYVVTNAHVVRGCSELQLIDTGNERIDATLVAEDTVNDLAVLKAAHRWPAAASFRDGSDLRPGESVVVIGYPLGDLLGSSAVITTGSLTATVGLRDDARLLQISAPIQLGNSGGPVLDGNGDVVGVVSGTIASTLLGLMTGVVPQNVNFAIKETVARSFLDQQKIHYGHAAGHHEISTADIGENARKFTVRVICVR